MKKKLQKQMDSMMEMTMDAITNNTKLMPALNELFKYAPKDEKSQFILLHEIANQYLHESLDIDSEFHDYSFEEGIKICIEEKVDYLKERFQICTIQFQLEDITRTITLPKRLPLADMTYFLMSSLDIACYYDFMINCEGIDYSPEEMQMCSIADLCLEKNDMFLLSFFNSETDEFFPVTGKLINEELNNKEIEFRGLAGDEMIVYGYMPAMISAGCGLKTCNSCKSDNSTYEVVDKHRNRFVTKCVCRYCYNVMYNCKPLSLFKFSKEIISMTPDSVRLSFTTESGNITEQILNKAQQAFIYEKNIQEDDQSTRGHFKRGVL